MPAAAAAVDLGSAHEERAVLLGLDRLAVGWLEEARPPGARVELGVGAEQLLAAAGAAIHTLVLGVPVGAGEGPLGPLLAQHVVLLGRQLRPPVRLALGQLLHCFSLPRRYRFSHSRWLLVTSRW